MARIASLLTFADTIEMLIDWAGRYKEDVSPAEVRVAIEAAYDEIAMVHHWTFLERPGRVYINARQTDGTIAYDHTGGSSERICTLTDTTNPSWINDASVRMGDYDVVSDVESGTSGGTTFTLDAQRNPGEDVDSGSSYVLYQRYVRLPNDFRDFVAPMPEDTWRLGRPITLAEMMAKDRYNSTSDQIQFYAIAEVPDLYDQLAMFVYPQPSRSETIDFAYTRYPRVLRYSGHDVDVESAGTISTTAGSTAVTGSSTAFASDMVGAIIRISSSATVRPTGRFGGQAYTEERAIAAVSSTTSITLDSAAASTASGKAYIITDPIDIGRVAKQAFLACCKKHLALDLGLPSTDAGAGACRKIEQAAHDALIRAMAADNPRRSDPSVDPTDYEIVGYTVSSD